MEVMKRLQTLLQVESTIDPKCLRHYNCNGYGLDDNDGSFIVNQLWDKYNNNYNNTIVTQLDLSSNNIRSNCISTIVNMLQVNTT
jgi:hypothetical protein